MRASLYQIGEIIQSLLPVDRARRQEAAGVACRMKLGGTGPPGRLVRKTLHEQARPEVGLHLRSTVGRSTGASLSQIHKINQSLLPVDRGEAAEAAGAAYRMKLGGT